MLPLAYRAHGNCIVSRKRTQTQSSGATGSKLRNSEGISTKWLKTHENGDLYGEVGHEVGSLQLTRLALDNID